MTQLNDLANAHSTKDLEMPCPKCGALAAADANYCEECGTRLGAEAAASGATPGAAVRCRCGAGPEAFDAQGYCGVCGRKRTTPPPARVPLPRDHVETVLTPNFALVTDRGVRHAVNQDDGVIALIDTDGQATQIIVVCDGVSSAQEADTASALAANAMGDSLRESLTAGRDVRAAMTEAVANAHAAVLTLGYQRDHDTLGPPGTTLVAAVVQEQTVTLGWVGDSRAYRVTGSEAALLTRDHSWVNEMVDSGQMTEADALRSKQAHAITRCVGPLNSEEPADVPEPSLVSCPLPPGCVLIVCTDGLWNYAPSPDELAAVVCRSPSTDALTVARQLVDFALHSGGHDNITAAVLTL